MRTGRVYVPMLRGKLVLLSDGASHQVSADAADALVQAYVACKIALEALPSLPADVRADAEQPLRAFCEAIEPAISRHYPELDKIEG